MITHLQKYFRDLMVDIDLFACLNSLVGIELTENEC